MHPESEMIGNIELVRRVAVGGMAEVFLAVEHGPQEFERYIVVKRILKEMVHSPGFVTMFIDEARLASRLSHPNIATLYGFGEVDGRFYITMECIDGPTVAQILVKLQGKGIPLDITLRAIADVCSGLHYAHELCDERDRHLGIIHRDISPQNVMLSRDGTVKIIDFGVARAATQKHVTELNQLKGKLAYMAPEMMVPTELRKADHRADIFSLGVLLYEMLTGKRLFRRKTKQGTIHAVCEESAPSVVDFGLPDAVDVIISKATAKKPEERFQTAQEMQDSIEALIIEIASIVSPSMISSFVQDLFVVGESPDITEEVAAESLQPDDATLPELDGAVLKRLVTKDHRLGVPMSLSIDMSSFEDTTQTDSHPDFELDELPVLPGAGSSSPESKAAEGPSSEPSKSPTATDDQAGVHAQFDDTTLPDSPPSFEGDMSEISTEMTAPPTVETHAAITNPRAMHDTSTRESSTNVSERSPRRWIPAIVIGGIIIVLLILVAGAWVHTANSG